MPGPLFVLHILIKCFKNKLISKVPVMQQALRIKELCLRSAGYAKGWAQHPLDRCSISLGCPLSWGQGRGLGIWREASAGVFPFGQLLEYIVSFGALAFSLPLWMGNSAHPSPNLPQTLQPQPSTSLPPFSLWDSQGLASQTLPLPLPPAEGQTTFLHSSPSF